MLNHEALRAAAANIAERTAVVAGVPVVHGSMVAVPLAGSVPPAAPPGGDGATTAGRAAVSRSAVEHEAGDV